ncbi:hypothetical protein NYE24_27945 [Paenibacillus sp. FSL H7-0350]|uniref:hypothetical protein n=1 Tax=Paenibacillus sp. FSL H7-0350 TaxID=2975345 RepID=UPI003158A5C6
MNFIALIHQMMEIISEVNWESAWKHINTFMVNITYALQLFAAAKVIMQKADKANTPNTRSPPNRNSRLRIRIKMKQK